MDNSNDELCMYRAVVVAKAFKELEEAKDMKKNSMTIKSLQNEYISLKKTYQFSVNRKQETAARNLQRSVQGAAPASFDDVVKVAHHLQRNIIVLNLDMQNAKPRNVQFETRKIKDYGWRTSLFVYLEVRFLGCLE